MASKRGLDQDPDYEDVSERQNKRQKVLQEDAKEATIRKIENIIRQQFSQEILNKECEMELIDQRLHQARTMLDRLRACIVARYYSTAGQSSWPQNKVSASQPPSIHPAVRKHLGKTVRVPPIGPQGEPASASTEKVESMSAATSTCLGALLTMKEENKTPSDSSGVPFQSVPLNGQEVKKENKSAETKVESPNRSLTENRTSRFKIKKRIVFGNVSRYIPVDKREENDQSTHKWMVYVRGDANFPDISGYVKKVWFFLHPSYRPNDLVEVSQPPFHLTRRGWGEFPVRVQLHFKDSRNKRVDIIHQLKLDRTYTGLQTLGAETVVDVELERDINDKLRRIPRVKSEPVLSRQVLPASGKDSLAFKEDKSETKCKAAENVTRSQEVKVVNPIKVIKTEPGISEENSRMLSTVTGDTSKDRKERETLSLHQKMTTVISQKEGLLSSIDKIKQDKIVPVTSVPKAIRTTSAGGDTGYCETRTISPSGATTDQMNSSKWTHVQIKSEPQSNVSGWQNVAKLSQSTEAGSNVTLSFKPVKTGAQVGCTGFKPISANLSSTANVSVPKNVSSPRLLQSPNSTVSPSLDLRQDKSSLSSPNVVAASTPKITCIGTPATAAAPSGGQAPALPPAVYVKCIDNEGRVYLIPQHLLTKVTASAGNSTQTAPKHTLIPPATAASILTSAKSPVSTPSVTLAQTTQKNTSGLTNLTARSVTLPVQATSTAKTMPSGGSNTHPVVSVCQSGTSPGKSPILCVGSSPAIQTKTTVVGSGNNSATLTYIVPAPPAAKGSQLMSLLSGSQPLSGAQMVISNSCPTGTQLVPTNSVGLPAKNISLAGTSKLQVKAMPAVSTVTPAALSKSSGATRSGTPVATPVASPNKNPTTQGSNSQIVIISGDLGTVKSQSRPGTASQSLTCPIIPQQSHVTPNAPMRLDSSVSPPKNLHQNLMAIGGKGDQRVTLMASGGISLLKTPPGTSQLSPHPESCVAKAVAQPSAMMVLQGKACPSLVPSKPNASVQTHNLRIQGSSIKIPGAVSPAGGAVVKTMAPRTVTSSSSAICHTNSSSPSLLTQTVKKSAGNVTGQSKTGEVQSLSGGSQTFLLKVVPDEETKSPVNQILLLPSTVTNTPTILQKGSTSIAHRNSTEKPANTMYMIGCGNNKAANDKPVTQASKMVKRITGLNRDKVGLGTTSAKEEDVEKTIRLEDYQSVEELVKCLVRKHPLWRKDLDRTIHPYCAPCQAAYLQWNVGKRRASEWMRAKAVQRKLLILLPKHPSLSGEQVWSAKGIVLWCRQQCFTPWDDEIRRKLRREPPRPIIASHENFNSLGSSEVIMNKLAALVASTDGHCDDEDIEVDVISLGDPVMRKVKKEPEEEGNGERKFLIPPTPLMEHVRDTAAQIGVDIQPVEVERNIFSTAVEEVVLAAMQSFIDDIIRRSVSLIFKEQRLPDELSLVELYRGIRSLPHCQFLTNQHLGIQVEDLPFPKTNFVQSQSLDRVT